MQLLNKLLNLIPNYILAVIILSVYINLDIILIKYKQYIKCNKIMKISLNFIILISKALPLMVLTIFYFNAIESIIAIKKTYFIILCFFIALAYALFVIRLILIRILNLNFKRGYRSIIIWVNLFMIIFTLVLAYIKTDSSIIEKGDRHLLIEYLDITWVTFLSAILILNTITKTLIKQLCETQYVYPFLINIKTKIKHIIRGFNYEEKVILSIYTISIFLFFVYTLYTCTID